MAPPRVIVVSATDGFTQAAASDVDDGGFPITDVNSPYARRRAILAALIAQPSAEGALEVRLLPVGVAAPSLDLALLVHDAGMVEYLRTAWARWEALGALRCDDFFATAGTAAIPALVPANHTFRDGMQLPGASVHSQACYYHCDRLTPIFPGLLQALLWDLAVVETAAAAIPFGPPSPVAGGGGGGGGGEHPAALPSPVYALVTHPGHHATRSTIGGFCYLNSAAILARLLQQRWADAAAGPGGATAGAAAGGERCPVAIVDVDYHFGNGSASIFYAEPSVYVASLHADPETEYPFNSGWAAQQGEGPGLGSTLCVPLPPGTTWASAGVGGAESYEAALRRTMAAVQAHGCRALVVSLGVDAYAHDPVHLPGAGHKLQLEDFERVGAVLGEAGLPTWLVQEGGYVEEVAGIAVRNLLRGLARAQQAQSK